MPMPSDDLREINAAILEYVGQSGSIQTLSMLQACVGKLIPTAAELEEALQDPCRKIPIGFTPNPLATECINAEYLRFARLTSKDICHGKLEGLIALGVDFPQADVLAHVTNRQIEHLAKRWPGPIFRVDVPKLSADVIHGKALPHYLVAHATC
jgi:hypothetical protein